MLQTDILTTLTEIDTSVFLSLNSHHAPFWDTFMKTFTGTFIWVPMYATILYLLLKNYHWKAVLCYIVAIGLAITLADQICSSLIRPAVARLRPSNLENPIVDLVHIVNGYRGGSYGFPSCHAANSFALVSYVWFTFRHRRLSLFFIIWAITNCYTRIYLGVHYPGDLLVGALIGGICGWICSTLATQTAVRLESAPRNTQVMKHTFVPMFVGLLTVIGITIYTLIKV